LGAKLDDAHPDGAREFVIDFAVRVQESSARQFNLHVSDGTGVPDSSQAVANLRYQNGWQTYNGTGGWQSLATLNPLTPGQWHRVRFTGLDWGLPGARYHLEVSDAGSASLTSAVTNITHFQKDSATRNAARFFVFTAVFGNNPGFDIDEMVAQVVGTAPPSPDAILNISGTYPHLAVFSSDGEAGIGAVAPWAGRLWFVTYPPHQPRGSSDKLWMVDSNLTLTARPESVGGTHASRLIHRESQQLIIGPYFIDTNANVRAIPGSKMPGRLTAAARHLTDPANKVYFMSMEEGNYEVDVRTLDVVANHPDMQSGSSHIPGTHGKGAYSGQGRLIYANNGESGWSISSDPGFSRPVGALVENPGRDWTNGWSVVERHNFCEVTGPGGIYGAARDDDPIWSTGWDKRSVMLKLLDDGVWHTFRLPKGSYTHDAFHGWYTEWPRIREIVDGKLLMHMHGLFYDFPRTFRASQTGGLVPICTYLKMPVDYCWWNGQLVMGRDDASTTGGNSWAGQSHSAPWFGQLSDLEQWGPPAGFGGPWKEDAVVAQNPSDPFLIRGFQNRVLHLKHATESPVSFALEYDTDGTGTWRELTAINLPAAGYAWYLLPRGLTAAWVRLVPRNNAVGVTAYFHLGNPPREPLPTLFAGIADVALTHGYSDGIIRPQTGNARILQFGAHISGSAGNPVSAYYEIDGAFVLTRKTNTVSESALRSTYSLAAPAIAVDDASVLVADGANRYRLPKTHSAYDSAFPSGWPRGKREVVTERDLFQAHGTFYELPKSSSGGFRRIRPITSHGKHISDFASWRGLFVVAGTAASAVPDGHFFRSTDGQAGLWFGNVDDLWRMGPPWGQGGPWINTPVAANAPSDPYLMYGYEHKVLQLAHNASQDVTFVVEVDFAADNSWSEYGRFIVPAGQVFKHVFPDGYSAHWVRLKTLSSVTATAMFSYGPAAPQQAFLDWIEPFALPPASSADALMARDDEGDGWSNWVEFIIGSDPTAKDRDRFPPVYALTSSNLLYEIAMRFGSLSHRSAAQISTNLAQWTPVPPDWELSGISQNGLAPDFWRRAWRIPLSDEKLFVRHTLDPDMP